jgi:hypothetical protein
MPIGTALVATGSGTTTCNVTIPSGAQAGQGALLVIACQNDGSISTPSGWTQVHAPQQAGSGTRSAVYKAIIQASGAVSPGAVVSISTGGVTTPKAVSMVVVWPSTDTVDPVHATGTPATYITSGTTRATPSVVTSDADTRIVEIIASKQTDGTNYTAPAGYTKLGQVLGTGSSVGIGLGTRTADPAAGTYGGDNWTCDVSGGSAITYAIALAPALGTQTARPATDVTDWPTAEPAVAVGQDQAARIGETTRDDATYLETSANPSGEVGEWKFPALVDPISSSGHVVRYVLSSAGGATSSSVAVALRQGSGTTIASWTETSVPASPTLYEHTLSGAEADAITNYADLRLRVTATAS